MKIEINPPITKKIIADYYELSNIIDSISNKTVVANITTTIYGPQTLVLWENEEYDEIGQWTDEDAYARIAEILAEK